MHTETLAPNTKQALKKLSRLPLPSNFYLSGGTALALHLGHRQSEDLDFFSPTEFDPESLHRLLESHFTLSDITLDQGTLNCFSDQVKLQFLHYPYRSLEKPQIFSRLNVSSVPDIACTKLITISARGSKKDFIDLYFLLQTYSLDQLLGLLTQKYHGVGYNLLHVLKSLVYFDTAEEQPLPKMHQDVSWAEVKKLITTKVKEISL